jgi:ribose 5-phosphate isomerase RpiB
VCAIDVGDGRRQLAAHFADLASRSDGAHVMWLNRNVTKQRVDEDTLTALLDELFATGRTTAVRVER